MQRKRFSSAVEQRFREKTLAFFNLKTWVNVMSICSFASCLSFFGVVLSYDLHQRIVREPWHTMYGNYTIFFVLGIFVLAFIADVYTSKKFSGKNPRNIQIQEKENENKNEHSVE